MGKKKSALFLVLVTVLLLGLCFMCTTSFLYGGYKGFYSVPSMTQKDALLGNGFAEGYRTQGNSISYYGGGYTTVYYPEGVITEKEYQDSLASLQAAADESGKGSGDETPEEKALREYRDSYIKIDGSTFRFKAAKKYDPDDAENSGAVTSDGAVIEEFQTAFDNAVAQLKQRVSELDLEHARIDVVNGYGVQVFVPTLSSKAAQVSVFDSLGHVGEVTVSYGSDEASATPLAIAKDETVRDYVKGAYAISNAGTTAVALRLTKAGQKAISDWTSANDGSLYISVGGKAIVNPSYQTSDSATIGSTLYITRTDFTKDSAKAIALTIDSALNGKQTDLTFSMGDVYRQNALFGDLALTLCYAAFGVVTLAMLVFFFVRYRRLGFVHLYTFLIYLFPMILLIWGIPFLHIGIETFLAVLLGMVLLSVSNIVTYESARRDVFQGKTVATSIKNGYKKCFWGLFDLHIIAALAAFVTYFIATTQLATFAFTFGIAAVLSGLCSLAIGRFLWATMMSFSKKKAEFCHFKVDEGAQNND